MNTGSDDRGLAVGMAGALGVLVGGYLFVFGLVPPSVGRVIVGLGVAVAVVGLLAPWTWGSRQRR